MEEDKPIKEKVDELYNAAKIGKIKKLKLHPKSKVKKAKIKKGWIGIIKIDENGNMTGEKQKIEGSTFKTKDGIYHASDGREILFWNGKFPVIIQPSWKENPLKIRNEEDKNETYGQAYIKARMLSDTIKVKKGGGSFIWIIVIAVAAYLVAHFVLKVI